MLSRKEREMLQRKNDIIDAAYELFIEKGYEIVNMDMIAQKSEFSRRTLYSYFNGKNDLIVEVILKAFAEIDHDFQQLFNSERGCIEKMFEMGKMYFSFFKATPALYPLLKKYDIVVHNNIERLSETTLRDLKGFKPNLTKMVEELIKTGQNERLILPDVIPELAANYFWKALYGIVHQYIEHAKFPDEFYNKELFYLLRGITKADVIKEVNQ